MVGGFDPEDFSNDGVMSQAITAVAPYELHAKERILTEPAIILTATDGCFGYYRTPMEFEGVLLETLLLAESLQDWQERLIEQIGLVAADDYSMMIGGAGFESFEEMQRAMQSRKKYFDEQYAAPLRCLRAADDQEGILTLWKKYRAGYLPTGEGETRWL